MIKQKQPVRHLEWRELNTPLRIVRVTGAIGGLVGAVGLIVSGSVTQYAKNKGLMPIGSHWEKFLPPQQQFELQIYQTMMIVGFVSFFICLAINLRFEAHVQAARSRERLAELADQMDSEWGSLQ